MVQILVQKWSKKSLKKVQLSKGRMVQSIFFFLRKVHYPNSSSFVLICFFVCFSCCFVCLLVMLHFSAFLPFPLYISSQLWSWLRQDAMVQEAIISGHDLGRLTHLPSIRPLLPLSLPKNSFDGHLPLVKLSSKKHLPTPPPPRSWPLAAKRQTNKKRN